MQHLVRKRQLGWSNLGGLVGVRNLPVKKENNKESGIPFRSNSTGEYSKFSIVIGRYQLSGNSGTKQASSIWASNPTGREDGNSAGTVDFSRQPSANNWEDLYTVGLLSPAKM